MVNLSYLQSSGVGIIHLINSVIIPLLLGVAVIGFIYAVLSFFFSRDDEGSAKHEESRKRVVWGVIAIFVIVSVWGFVSILQNIFGVSNNNNNVVLPTVPGTY